MPPQPPWSAESPGPSTVNRPLHPPLWPTTPALVPSQSPIAAWNPSASTLSGHASRKATPSTTHTSTTTTTPSAPSQYTNGRNTTPHLYERARTAPEAAGGSTDRTQPRWNDDRSGLGLNGDATTMDQGITPERSRSHPSFASSTPLVAEPSCLGPASSPTPAPSSSAFTATSAPPAGARWPPDVGWERFTVSPALSVSAGGPRMAAKGRWKTDQTTSTTPEVQPATQSCARIVAQNSLITSVAALDVPKSAQDAVNPTINGNPLGSAYRKFGSKSVRPLSKGKESISMRATKNSTAPILGSSSAPVILPQDKLAASTSGMNTTDDSESRTHEGIDIGDVDQPMSDSDYVQEPKTRPNPEPKVPARPQAKTKPGVGRKKVDPSGNLPAEKKTRKRKSIVEVDDATTKKKKGKKVAITKDTSLEPDNDVDMDDMTPSVSVSLSTRDKGKGKAPPRDSSPEREPRKITSSDKGKGKAPARTSSPEREPSDISAKNKGKGHAARSPSPEREPQAILTKDEGKGKAPARTPSSEREPEVAAPSKASVTNGASTAGAENAVVKKSPRLWIPQLQYARCMSARYKDVPFSKCLACTRRWAGDTCRFQHLRYFLHDQESGEIPGFAFIEYHRTPYTTPTFTFPSKFNVPLTAEHIKELKCTIAKALQDVLQKEVNHASHKATIYRAREKVFRATCDMCMTSLFAQVWFCRLCGRELCGECYDRVCDITRIPIDDLVAYKAELKKRRADIGKGVSLSCNKRKEHTYAQFTPITRFEKLEIATAIMEMKSMSLADKPTQTQSQVRESAEVDPASEPEVPNFVDPCPPQGPDEPEAIKHRSHDTPFFNVNELKLRVFRKLWAKGKPLVVYGLGSKLRLPWTPEALSKKYGTDECSVSDCETGVSKQTTVAEFFEHFGDYRARKQVWKLKDWPSTTEFKEMFPELYADFCNVVPMPDYVRPDGISNLAAYFPIDAVAPDLGPKMYNAYATTDDPGSQGSTKLHMDISDALNIMTFASKTQTGGCGYAIWDIFDADDSNTIRTWLRARFKPEDNSDPIHTQRYYLDRQELKKLWEDVGVKSHRIYQTPGQAVFIPAGCAHQVANKADCVKVAVDFVSPENINRCEKLTQEFRAQNQAKVWKDDVLQLRSMMWFAWMSFSQQPRLTGPEGDDGGRTEHVVST